MTPTFLIVYHPKTVEEFAELIEKYESPNVKPIITAEKNKSAVELLYNKNHGRFRISEEDRALISSGKATRDERIQARMEELNSKREETWDGESVTGFDDEKDV